MNTRKLWIGFLAVVGLSFAVLLYFGREIYRQAPPIPDKVITTDGTVLFTGQDIKDGQNIWQSLGGQEIGTVWDMVHTRPRTGVQTGYTVKLFSFWKDLHFRLTAFLTKS